MGRRFLIARIVAVLLLVAACGWLVYLLAVGDFGRADQGASVTAGLIAAGSAVVTLATAGSPRWTGDWNSPASGLEEAGADLRAEVQRQWREEYAMRGLLDGAMPVRWRLASAALMDRRPEDLGDSGRLARIGGDLPGQSFEGNAAAIGDFADAFLALDRQRLIIVGPPGSGKTTLALQLLLELLRRGTDQVPVLFTLDAWHGHDLTRWLVDELGRNSPVLAGYSPSVQEALITRNRVLPVLDGLDELPAERRASVLMAINNDPLLGGFVLTSRQVEFRDALERAGRALRDGVVVSPRALGYREIAEYLRDRLSHHRRRTAWEAVLSEGPDGRLARIGATPLGLWLLRRVYLETGRDPGPLLDREAFPDDAALQRHLLDELVPAAVDTARRTGPETDVPDSVCLQRWLGTLAGQLEASRGEHDWQWWRLAWRELPSARGRTVFGGLVGLIWFGPVLTLGLSLPLDMRVLGPLPALMVALLCAYRMNADRRPHRVALRIRGRAGEFWRGVLVSLGFAVGIGSGIGFAGYAAFGFNFGVVGGFGTGAAVLLGGVLTALIGSAEPSLAANTPLRSYRDDRKVTLLTVAAVAAIGLCCGAVGGAVGAILGDFEPGPLVGAFRGGVVGVVGGLVLGAITAVCLYPWPIFLAVALLPALRGDFPAPWLLMSSVDAARRLGLLRTVGAKIQFHHALLQARFAASNRPDRWATRETLRLRRLAAGLGCLVLLTGAGVGGWEWNARINRRAVVQAVRRCLPGGWDRVALESTADTAYGKVFLKHRNGGVLRWTFSPDGTAVEAGEASDEGVLQDGRRMGSTLRVDWWGTTNFTFEVQELDTRKAYITLTTVQDNTSYEIFLDGHSQGRRRYSTSSPGFEVRCDRNELHLEGYEVTAAYVRHP